LSITKQSDPSSTITEVYWGKLGKSDQNISATSVPASEPLVGAYGGASIPKNDPEFNLVDNFVRNIEKEELKNATVIAVRMQVVAGINYKIDYQTSDNTTY